MQERFLIIVDIFLCLAVALLAWRDAIRGREIALLRQALNPTSLAGHSLRAGFATAAAQAVARRDVAPPSSSAVIRIDRPADVRIVEAAPLRRSARKVDSDGEATIIAVR